MAGSGQGAAYRQWTYSVTDRPRLSRAAWRLSTAAAAMLMALASGGCSFSYKLDSLWGSDDAAKPPAAQPAPPLTDPAPTGAAPTGSSRAPSPRTAATQDDDLVTGSISPARPLGAAMGRTLPPERDLVYAKAAASVALSRSSMSASVPWENPLTGARGTVTALASAYREGGTLCRDFLASYVRGADEAWLQGEACQMQRGKWHVRTLRPWSRG